MDQHWAVDFGIKKPPEIKSKISYKSRFVIEAVKVKSRNNNIITESEHKKINRYIRDMNGDGVTDPKILLTMVLDIDYMAPYLEHKQGRAIIANKIFKIQKWDERKKLSKKKYLVIDLLKQQKDMLEIMKQTGASRVYINEITRFYKRFVENV